MRMVKRGIYLFLCVGLLLAGASGCAGIVKLKPEERGVQAALIKDFSTKWDNYTIYSTVWPGNRTVALLFDLKSDDGVVLADGWTKVDPSTDEASFLALLQLGESPRLFQILGPDGHLFGYLYTAVPVVLTQLVDARTARIYKINPPPAPK
jgi:hypothetical protein